MTKFDDAVLAYGDATHMPVKAELAELWKGASVVDKTAAEWAADTSIPPNGQINRESDSGKLKLGDGVKTFAQLIYFQDGVGGSGGNGGADLELFNAFGVHRGFIWSTAVGAGAGATEVFDAFGLSLGYVQP